MDGEMEAEGVKCFEIDIDCEFDAPRYFELGTAELPAKVQQAELWFETAGNYPHSPLTVRVSVGKKEHHEFLDTLFKLRDADSLDAKMDLNAYLDPSLLCGSFSGRDLETFQQQDLPMDNRYATFKGTGFNSPSFMKPTTSQLARENFVQSGTSSWLQKPFSVKSRSSEDRGLIHSVKRQKLAGGLVCKVVGMTQQSDLLHKISKKECFVNCNPHTTKTRVTIPREPVLETARRAKTFRAQRSTQFDVKEACTSAFKALPLNRKIFEAPSVSFPQKSTPKLPEFQEFKLRTSVRAIQRLKIETASLITDTLSYSSAVKDCWMGSKKSEYQPCGLLKSYDKKRRGSIRKLSSLNREEKKFNFSSKRNQQQNPLSELFNKLSLSTQVQQDSKENVINAGQVHEGCFGISLI